MFLVTVDDPYVFYSNKDSSKYSVSISDSSVAQVTGITPKSNDSFEMSVYFAKAGSADFVFKYGNQTKKVTFTVAKTVITVSSSISLKVGDTTMFSNYVFKTGGGSITIKKVKSSNKKIVDAAGGFLDRKEAWHCQGKCPGKWQAENHNRDRRQKACPQAKTETASGKSERL